jgi:hypothetical protein
MPSESKPRPSQCDLILACLLERMRTHPNDPWVPMPQLANISGSLNVHSRISNLRDRGYMIAHRQERRPDRVILSFYCAAPEFDDVICLQIGHPISK